MAGRRRVPQDPVYFDTCGICGRSYISGPHRYEGKYLPAYELAVCRTCFAANWDGWSPALEPNLIGHLNAKGLPIPPRNAAGLLPRGD